MSKRVLDAIDELDFWPSHSQLVLLFEPYGLVEVGEKQVSYVKLRDYIEATLDGSLDTFETRAFQWMYGEVVIFMYNSKDKEDIRQKILALEREECCG